MDPATDKVLERSFESIEGNAFDDMSTGCCQQPQQGKYLHYMFFLFYEKSLFFLAYSNDDLILLQSGAHIEIT
jgi:hypothetical protein